MTGRRFAVEQRVRDAKPGATGLPAAVDIAPVHHREDCHPLRGVVDRRDDPVIANTQPVVWAAPQPHRLRRASIGLAHRGACADPPGNLRWQRLQIARRGPAAVAPIRQPRFRSISARTSSTGRVVSPALLRRRPVERVLHLLARRRVGDQRRRDPLPRLPWRRPERAPQPVGNARRRRHGHPPFSDPIRTRATPTRSIRPTAPRPRLTAAARRPPSPSAPPRPRPGWRRGSRPA